ncbi:MAG: S8 family serine peptidase, partial [Cyanobacteria bacterium J06559_3]
MRLPHPPTNMAENQARATNLPFQQSLALQSPDIDSSVNPSDQTTVSQEVIIKFKPAAGADFSAERQSLLTQLDATVIETTQTQGFEQWRIDGMSLEEAIAQYRDHPAIEYIEPNYTLTAGAVLPNDPSYDELWGLNNAGRADGTDDADIDAPEAGDIRTGSPDVVIGVIDTGVDYTHPDLVNNMWTNSGEIPDNGIDDDNNGFVDDVHGYDFVNNDGDPFDDHDHGTHVAGTIAAEGNNGIGVTGVTWSAQIMALKFLDAFGFGTTFDAIQAIEYAILMGADVTNNSWGGGAFSQPLQDAIAAAGEAGQVFVAAAGNFSSNTDTAPSYPAAYDLDNIISVAATDDDDQLASFSNFGATSVDLGAPGVDILSTTPGNNYGFLSGTSMASPHVTGVVSLLLAENPDLTPPEIKTRLIETVDPLPSLAGNTVSGGRLNAFNALFAPDAAKIQGAKWNDLNADGIRGPAEPGLANWTIYLDANDNGILDSGERFTQTSADGTYAFNFLEAGTYTVKEVQQPGWERTAPLVPTVVPLAAGETVAGVDIGNFLASPAGLSGSKWHDLNENGLRDAAEPSLADWTMYLDANRNGTLDDGELSTVTDSSGNYSFTGLVPNTYAVAEVQQPGWRQTQPAVVNLTGNLFGEANDTLATALGLGFVPGSPGTFTGEGSIGDNAGVTATADVDLMQLQLAAGDRITIDIDTDDPDSLLDPILRLFDSSGSQVTVSDDSPAPDEFPSFDSYIDYTATADGTYYIGVSSYSNFSYDPTVPGSSNGLSTGAYSLEISLNNGEDAGVHIVTLGPDELAENVDFGNLQLPPGSISGRQWNDLNGNGFLEANEPGLANWTVYLDQNQNGALDDGEIATVTDDSGAYTFSDLPENTYTVAPVLPATWQQTTPGVASGQVVPDPEGDTFGFGATQLDIASTAASVSGDNLLLDMNFSTPVAAPSAGLPESVVGFWDLDLDQETATGLPSNQSQSAPPDQQGGPLGVDAFIDLGSESFQPGLVNIVSTVDSSLLGTAAITYGASSLQVAVPLSLLGDDGALNYGTVIGTTSELTDAAPNSAFGTLQIVSSPTEKDRPNVEAAGRGDRSPTVRPASQPAPAVEPPDAVKSPQLPAPSNTNALVSPTTVIPSLSGTYSVELAAGEDITDVDFGNWQPAILSGTKWHDINENGLQDGNEPGLADWIIFIDDNQNDTLDPGERSTVTDATGNYTFAVQAGTYTVAEVLQPGWFAVVPDGSSYTVSLQPGESDTALDFGSQELPAAIAGQTWHDLNGNSQLDPNEPGLPGWVVYLDENQNNQLDAGETSTITGPNGEYTFEGLFSGTYVVAEVLPENWLQTSPGLGSSFETNDFNGWETIGNARIETANFGVAPPDGDYQALLMNSSSEASDPPVPVTELETFLGLNPGDLDELSSGTVTEGAAMKQTVTVSAGTELTFDWNFLTNEGSSSTYNDLGFITIASATSDVLANTNSPLVASATPFQQETGYETFTYTFATAGTFTVGLGVADVTDGVVDSGLLIDNLTYSGNRAATGVNVVTLDPGEAIDDVNFGNVVDPGAAPVFESDAFTFTVLEGQSNGALLGLLPATDADAEQTLMYSILSGNESGTFALDSTTGALTVADNAGLDFEAGDTPLELTVQVTDSGTPVQSDIATVAIAVLNVNEAPVIDTSSLVFEVGENSPVGTIAGIVNAGDPEGTLLTYSLTGGNDAGIFAINNAGYLTIADNTALDFESGPLSHTLELTVSDGLLSTTASVTVDILDENEAPDIQDQRFYLPENAQAGTVVGAIAATDPDAGQVLTYAIKGDAAALFSIDPTGHLWVNNPAQLTDETYELTVTVTDNNPTPRSDTAQIIVRLPEDQLPDTALIDIAGTEYTIFGTIEDDTLTGTEGNDAIHAGLGAD